MNYENLTPEQREKAKACKTAEELLALAKAEGYEPAKTGVAESSVTRHMRLPVPFQIAEQRP